MIHFSTCKEIAMIRFRITELLLDKSSKEGRRISLEEVANDSGVHRVTLSRMINKPGYNSTTDILDALCDYFDCELADLAHRVPKKETNNSVD